MGYSVYTNLVYGVQLHNSDLEIVDVERGCSHDLPGEQVNFQEVNFCPECGKPAFVEVRKRILVPSSLNEFKRDYEDDTFILGMSLGSIDTNHGSDRPTPVRRLEDEERQELESFLEFYELKQKPQVWLVLRHSY